ncbi:MAG: TolC family protein [Bacteroidia bacterium]
MNQKHISFLLSFLFFFPSLLSAQDGGSKGLKDCILYALEHNYNLRMTRFDEYITKKEAQYLVGLGLPQISASVDLQDNIKRPQFIFSFVPGQPAQKVPVGQQWQHNANVQFSQLIFDATFLLGTQAAKEYVNLSKINTQRTETELIANITSAYYNACRVKESLSLLEANVKRLEKRFKDTEAMYQNGLVEKTDLERVQIILNNIKTEQRKYERLVGLSVDMLKFQMGMDIETALNVTTNLANVDVENEKLDVASKLDFSKHFEYRLIEQQSLLEDYNRRRYIAQYYPSLVGFGYYQWNMQASDIIDFSETATFGQSAIGLKLRVPIFDGLRTNVKVQQSRATIDRIQVSKEMFESGAKLKLNNAVTEVQNSKEAYLSQKANVALAKSVYDKTMLKYKEGIGSSLDLNEAETAMKEAENNLLNAKFDYLQAKLQLMQARGELRETYLEK